LSVICCAATVKSLAFQFTLKTQHSQGRRWFWSEIYDLWMKLIFVNFKRIWIEMYSLFFSLMKRTKNQGCGIVVKAQFFGIYWRLSLRALYFVPSWKADFVGDLLQSYRQKSSISVHAQNPTFPRPEVI
jgi:hypothetical protein